MINATSGEAKMRAQPTVEWLRGPLKKSMSSKEGVIGRQNKPQTTNPTHVRLVYRKNKNFHDLLSRIFCLSSFYGGNFLLSFNINHSVDQQISHGQFTSNNSNSLSLRQLNWVIFSLSCLGLIWWAITSSKVLLWEVKKSLSFNE